MTDVHFDRVRFSWTVVAWLLGVIVTALLTYGATTNTVNARVSVLESKQEAGEKRLERIEQKLDRLLERQP